MAAKVVDIAIQLLLLVQIMEAGYPRTLVLTFTAVVVLNCLVTAVLMHQRRENLGFTEIFIDMMYV